MNFTEVGKKDYLNYSTLVDGTGVDAICYVSSIKGDLDVSESPYYRMYVKTIDGVTMTAFIFGVNEVAITGLKINALRHRYIRLNARVSEKFGRMSLIVNSATVLVGEEAEEALVKFQNVLPGVDDYFETVSSVVESSVGRPLNAIYKSKRYADLYEGASGGIVVYAGKVITHLSVLVSEEDLELTLRVFAKSLFIYEKLLTISTNSNLVTTSDKLQVISSCPNDNFEDKLVIETLSGLMDLSSPNHLVPIAIKMASDVTINSSKLYNTWKALLPGGTTGCLGYQLLKY